MGIARKEQTWLLGLPWRWVFQPRDYLWEYFEVQWVLSLSLEPNDSFLSKTQYKLASPKGVGGLVAARIPIWAVAVGPKAAVEDLTHDLGGTLWCVKKLAIWGWEGLCDGSLSVLQFSNNQISNNSSKPLILPSLNLAMLTNLCSVHKPLALVHTRSCLINFFHLCEKNIDSYLWT